MLAATSSFIVADIVVVLLLSLSGIISSEENEKSRAEDGDIPAENEYLAAGLEKHNKYRALHRSPPLTLDNKMNELAGKCAVHYAKTLLLDHSCPYKYKNQGSKNEPYGENIYFRNETDAVNATKYGIKFWYEEMGNWSFTTHSPKPGTKSVTHFTQLVWKASEKLGIGCRINKRYGIYMVALYDPPGNIKDQFKDNVLPISSPDDSDYENDCDYDNSSAVSNVLIFSTKLTYLLACAMSHCVLKLLLYLYEIE